MKNRLTNRLRRIFTKLLIRLTDVGMLVRAMDDLHIQEMTSNARMGPNSRLYPCSQIHNLQDNPDHITIGTDTHIRGELLLFRSGGNIDIGDFTFVGEGSRIWSAEKISIGHHVLISYNVSICDTNVHEINHLERSHGFKQIILNGHSGSSGKISQAPVVIGDFAWVNPGAIILKGVTIGQGAIIAAGSVVTGAVAPYTLVAGNPARKIKDIDHGPDA